MNFCLISFVLLPYASDPSKIISTTFFVWIGCLSVPSICWKYIVFTAAGKVTYQMVVDSKDEQASPSRKVQMS